MSSWKIIPTLSHIWGEKENLGKKGLRGASFYTQVSTSTLLLKLVSYKKYSMTENKYSKLQGEPQTRSNDGWGDSSREQRESWPLFSHKEKLSFSQMPRVWSPWLRAVRGRRGGVPRQSFTQRCRVLAGGGSVQVHWRSWTAQGLSSAAQFSQRYVETKGNVEGKTQNTHCEVLEESLGSPPSQARPWAHLVPLAVGGPSSPLLAAGSPPDPWFSHSSPSEVTAISKLCTDTTDL